MVCLLMDSKHFGSQPAPLRFNTTTLATGWKSVHPNRSIVGSTIISGSARKFLHPPHRMATVASYKYNWRKKSNQLHTDSHPVAQILIFNTTGFVGLSYRWPQA
jgi:hypothetical protein